MQHTKQQAIVAADPSSEVVDYCRISCLCMLFKSQSFTRSGAIYGKKTSELEQGIHATGKAAGRYQKVLQINLS